MNADELTLNLCLVHSSPPVHLLSAVRPKPGWPISTRDRPHLQDWQGKVSFMFSALFICIMSCFYALIVVVRHSTDPTNHYILYTFFKGKKKSLKIHLMCKVISSYSNNLSCSSTIFKMCPSYLYDWVSFPCLLFWRDTASHWRHQTISQTHISACLSARKFTLRSTWHQWFIWFNETKTTHLFHPCYFSQFKNWKY